jgi:ribose-phosphate pyrophosphokinase
MNLFAGNSNHDLALRISKHLNIPLSNMECDRFNDGECHVKINENVRQKDCYVIQSTTLSKSGSPNDNLMELCIIVDALKRATAKTVTVVVPCFGYQRQDRKDSSRAPISARLVATILESVNVDRVICMDLHAGQIQGFFSSKTPVDNLFAENDLVDYIRNNILHKYSSEDVVIVSPDEGGIKRASRIGQKLGLGIAVIHKERSQPGIVNSMTLLGNVDNKIAILVDDMIDSAGTACIAANLLKEKKAKEVYMVACHLILSGQAIEKIKNSVFTQVAGTNTVECRFEQDNIIEKNGVMISSNSKIAYIDISWLIATAIKRTYEGKSLKEIYDNNITQMTVSPIKKSSESSGISEIF